MIPHAVQFSLIPVLLPDLLLTLALALYGEQSSLGVSDSCLVCLLRLVGLAICLAARRERTD